MGAGEIEGGPDGRGRKRRLVNEARIRRFSEKLERWSFDEVRSMGVEWNVARFWNEFRDLYDETFPWVEDKRRRRDEEKPWLDDVEFKELVREKEDLYSRKIRGNLEQEGLERLDKVGPFQPLPSTIYPFLNFVQSFFPFLP